MSFLARPLALLRGGGRGVCSTFTPMASLSSSPSPSSRRPIPIPIPPAASTTTTTTTTTQVLQDLPSTRRAFTTTPHPQKRASGKLNPNQAKGADKKIYIMRRYRAKRLPAPLRMGRNRYLRHWTIHRAWHLYQRYERDRRRNELMRMQQGMAGALEELRRTSGPGAKSEGHLYRSAIIKNVVWGSRAIPIEYARTQVETPPRVPWNHDWRKPAY